MKKPQQYFVFISHSGADAWCAQHLHKDVVGRGADAFLSELDVEGGADIGDAMRDAMEKANECLVLYSPEAARSKNVWVEIGGAWMQKKRVTVILSRLTVADVTGDANFPPYLKSLNFYDLNRDLDSKYLSELETRIENHGGRPRGPGGSNG